MYQLASPFDPYITEQNLSKLDGRILKTIHRTHHDHMLHVTAYCLCDVRVVLNHK